MTANRIFCHFSYPYYTYDFAINSHTLAISSNGERTVTQSGSGGYNYGSNPAISATPASGYSFSHWVGDGVANINEPSTTIAMTEDRKVSAYFEPVNSEKYLLIISSEPAAGGITTGANQYNENTEANISATAQNGYSFTGWSGELLLPQMRQIQPSSWTRI